MDSGTGGRVTRSSGKAAADGSRDAGRTGSYSGGSGPVERPEGDQPDAGGDGHMASGGGGDPSDTSGDTSTASSSESPFSDSERESSSDGEHVKKRKRKTKKVTKKKGVKGKAKVKKGKKKVKAKVDLDCEDALVDYASHLADFTYSDDLAPDLYPHWRKRVTNIINIIKKTQVDRITDGEDVMYAWKDGFPVRALLEHKRDDDMETLEYILAIHYFQKKCTFHTKVSLPGKNILSAIRTVVSARGPGRKRAMEFTGLNRCGRCQSVRQSSAEGWQFRCIWGGDTDFACARCTAHTQSHACSLRISATKSDNASVSKRSSVNRLLSGLDKLRSDWAGMQEDVAKWRSSSSFAVITLDKDIKAVYEAGKALGELSVPLVEALPPGTSGQSTFQRDTYSKRLLADAFAQTQCWCIVITSQPSCDRADFCCLVGSTQVPEDMRTLARNIRAGDNESTCRKIDRGEGMKEDD